MSKPEIVLTLLEPDVTGLQASKLPLEEEHLEWSVGYAPTDYPRKHARVVIGTINAGGAGGSVDVSVGAMMAYSPENDPGDEFAAVLRQSDALETLWDIARLAFYGAAGVAGVRTTVPVAAPIPEINVLHRVDQEDDDRAVSDLIPD